MFGLEPSPKMLVLWGLCVGAIFLPMYLRSHRGALARKKLIKSKMENKEKRIKMEQEAIKMVKKQPAALQILAEEAFKSGRFPLTREILARLPETKKYTKISKELEQKMAPRPDLTPDSALNAIEQMLHGGLLDAAQVRVTRALLQWPNAPRLRIAEERVAKAIASVDAARETDPPLHLG